MTQDNNIPAVPVTQEPLVITEPTTSTDIARIEDMRKSLDIRDTKSILAFGSQAQQQISDFSDKVLSNVRTSDAGEVGDTLSSLVVELKNFDTQGEKKKGIMGLFQSAKVQMDTMKARYDKVEKNVEVITTTLQGHENQLLSDIKTFDELYVLNQQAFQELNLYIKAGDEELIRLKDEELKPLNEKAQQTGDTQDAQLAHDFAAQVDRFEKKIHDLRLTRTVSQQIAPQIRLMQNSNAILAEKIQSALVNTIPLWKGQMVIAMGAANTQRALSAQQAVTDATNDLLRKNADALKMNTVETAKAAERGIVDIDTLRHTNQALIDTLQEVQRIQQEGTKARAEAEKELTKLEGELRDNLLAFSNSTGTTQAPGQQG